VSETLQCLKKYSQRLDLEIAKEMGVPLATVRQRLAGLAATGEIMTCTLTRFEHGKRIDAWQCRPHSDHRPTRRGELTASEGAH
jgi:predicted ArsR family transcriptional regulator